MAHAPYLRDKARELRLSKRLTIDELAERLALSRSTIYHWVRDLPIPGSGPGGEFQTDAQRLGTRAMQRKYKQLRDEAYAEGLQDFKTLAADPTFRDFVCLYMAEGYKRNRNVVSIANSDPAIIVLSQWWIRRLASKKLCYSIQYHADQDLDELSAFWSATLDIQPDAIRLQRKSNSNQLTGRIWRCKHGVMTVASHDTLLRARLGAWMDRLRSSWTGLESGPRDVAKSGIAPPLGGGDRRFESGRPD
jgi:excisionase family DNA binding protein